MVPGDPRPASGHLEPQGLHSAFDLLHDAEEWCIVLLGSDLFIMGDDQ